MYIAHDQYWFCELKKKYEQLHLPLSVERLYIYIYIYVFKVRAVMSFVTQHHCALWKVQMEGLAKLLVRMQKSYPHVDCDQSWASLP